MMVSGKPLHAEEKQFIEASLQEQFPSIIARHLSLYYSQYNGGSRSTATVQAYIRTVQRRKAKAAAAA